jgi:hypothetical protein
MGIRTILIIEEYHAEKLSIVTGQMGYPQDFTAGVKLCDLNEPDPTPSTPATHYLTHDAAMPITTEDKFRRMAAGDYMPQVNWGEDVPDITETSAIAAAAALQVVSEAGGQVGDLDTILAAKGLRKVPEPSF